VTVLAEGFDPDLPTEDRRHVRSAEYPQATSSPGGP
jgi:hypothetical protein